MKPPLATLQVLAGPLEPLAAPEAPEVVEDHAKLDDLEVLAGFGEPEGFEEAEVCGVQEVQGVPPGLGTRKHFSNLDVRQSLSVLGTV